MTDTAKLHPQHEMHDKKLSMGMFLVTIGIVYGDIGTSPLYVVKSLIEGNGGLGEVSEEFIVGSLSLIIWTITLLTTIKYVLIAMNADNNGEGGIFSLYSLIKNCGKWLIVPAMIGGAALLADGVLTPAVTVTTAVEGLRSIELMNKMLGSGQTGVVIIVLAIICLLFIFQQAGTSKIGKAFGPMMLVWFVFLASTGAVNLIKNPAILKAFNPVYAIRILFGDYNHMGFMILGCIFLAATGAEALYSDMGHVGKVNIYASWPFVKVCLLLNYFGQCAWILENSSNPELVGLTDMNPFYMMLPGMLRPVAVILSAIAAVIASQALITGSYTLVSEAVRLDLMPHMLIKYPAETFGQIYIPTVNTVLWLGCSAVVLYFRSGSRIESAYGLAITLTMLMTTLLLSVYLWKIVGKVYLAVPLLMVFGAIESVFFVSSLSKFAHGGYVTVILALAILCIMIIWKRGTKIEMDSKVNLRLADYAEAIGRLRSDESIPYTAGNMVYLERGWDMEMADRDVFYSILDKDPKRAKAYWIISLQVTGEPYTMEYIVNTCGTDYLFRVNLILGFKVRQSINVYIRQIIQDLQDSGEMPPQNKVHSIYGPSTVDTFKYCQITKLAPAEGELSTIDSSIITSKYAIRKAIGDYGRWFGLESFTIIRESVPMFVKNKFKHKYRIHRVNGEK